MSMSEPFLPAHEPRAEPDPREHDLDGDVVLDPHADADPAPDNAPLVHAGAAEPPFRTPTAGDHLTAQALADELGDGLPG
jgi:hypothetical protein